ncbi:MAG: TetR/AcrR family transcriptional regulator [Kordiimonadaceae bacterium]|nr:TetR/AcrR family transcriptional regulator [Kordiimonadaceae bacterium]
MSKAVKSALTNQSSGKAEKSARTRAGIIRSARTIFARDGYADAALTDIIAAANITTGAVYYHFGDKKGLFQAVAESVEQEIMDRIAALRNTSQTPWEQFEQGISDTLEICSQPDIQRIVFRDAPSVIGLKLWRDIEMKYAFGAMQAATAQLTKSGVLKSSAPDITAQILLGSIIEAAHSIAQTPDKVTALASAKETLRMMVRSLKREAS